MGYNTVTLFSNDRISEARANPERTMDAIYAHALGNDRVPLPFNIQVQPAYHADLAPIFIGGANSLQMLGSVNWTQKSDIPRILREIAEEHGYKIAIRKRPEG